MITLQGKNGEANVYTDLIEQTAVGQIIDMLNQPITENTNVAIMPDVHAGKGSTVGTTLKLPEDRSQWKVSPNIVGVDIGCGMYSYQLNTTKDELDLKKIDEIIKMVVPVGSNVHAKPTKLKMTEDMLNNLTFQVRKEPHIHASMGTLGGGNHFIEIAEDENGLLWLTVHSGSRYLGLTVANHHQKIANESKYDVNEEREAIIDQLKKQGRQNEIQEVLKDLSEKRTNINGTNDHLAYLTGSKLDDYLNDMVIAQKYAHENRKTMLDLIVSAANLDVLDEFDSIHNFIDVESGIIRKGATSANTDERLIIPLNMRDGSLICRGKGNAAWNYSAPHGAGRVLSRSKAREVLDFKDYKHEMEKVYTTSLNKSNIDESPMAYKPIHTIIDNIGDTVDIVHHIKPIYNRKA